MLKSSILVAALRVSMFANRRLLGKLKNILRRWVKSRSFELSQSILLTIKLSALLLVVCVSISSAPAAVANDPEACFYDWTSYRQLFYCDSSDEPNLPSQYNNEISSVTVPQGHVLITYSGTNYVDQLSGYGSNDWRLQTWEQNIGSYKLETHQEAGVCFYDYNHHSALMFCSHQDQPNVSSQYHWKTQALSFPANFEITTYSQPNYVSPIKTYTHNQKVIGGGDRNIRSYKINVLTNTDLDSDGVLNNEDHCPTTSQGASVNTEGCTADEVLSAQPEGVCLYSEEGYAGIRVCYTVDESSLTGLWNDNPSSIGIKGGYEATLYQHWNYAGWSQEYLDSIPQLGVYNNDGSSLKVSFPDDDSDGVANSLDHCPSTPNAEEVDTDGCSQSQLDHDDDGISNSSDQCINTPTGAVVNIEGCSANQVLSAQPDGICLYSEESYAGDRACYTSDIDRLDGVWNDHTSSIGIKGDYFGTFYQHHYYGGWSQQYLVSTPALGSYNNDGSALKVFIIDDDADGILNSGDQCSNTPAGESVDTNGCGQSQLDDDGDGVFNNVDLCAATPSGEAVNQHGCTQNDDNQDADSDGVPDYLDQCPATPGGETSGADGCAPSQIDTDGDGTPDYLDAYPHQSSTQCSA